MPDPSTQYPTVKAVLDQMVTAHDALASEFGFPTIKPVRTIQMYHPDDQTGDHYIFDRLGGPQRCSAANQLIRDEFVKIMESIKDPDTQASKQVTDQFRLNYPDLKILVDSKIVKVMELDLRIRVITDTHVGLAFWSPVGVPGYHRTLWLAFSDLESPICPEGHHLMKFYAPDVRCTRSTSRPV